MAIPLVEVKEVRSRGGRTKGEKYAKYAQAIAKELSWLKEEVNKSSDGKIRIKVKDIKKVMGVDFVAKSDKAVYWALKFVLFHEGLVVETGTHKDGDKILVIRVAREEIDKLPPSLAVVLEPPEEDMPEPGAE